MAALDYAAADATRPPRRWPAQMFAGAILLVILAIFVPTNLTVRQVESSMDAVTGSMTWQTTCIFGTPSTTRIDVSPLERRLVRMGARWAPQPTFIHDKYIDIFGRVRGWGCGRTPPIYELASLLGDFVAASSDEEILAFVYTMESGTETEQRAAVEAASEKALGMLATRYRVDHD